MVSRIGASLAGFSPSLSLFLFLSLSHSLLPAHVRWRELSGQTASDRRWIASTAAVCRAEFTARTLSHNMLISGPHVRAAFVAWGPNQIAVASAISGQTFAMLGRLFVMMVGVELTSQCLKLRVLLLGILLYLTILYLTILGTNFTVYQPINIYVLKKIF